jgi:hypothetical protein
LVNELTHSQVRQLWLRGQALLPPQPAGREAVVEAARRAGGLQAQDIFAGTLGVRGRSTGTTFADVERARVEERTLLWTWAMRGTLHLMPTADVDWLLPLLGQVLVAAGARRRAELGLDEATYSQGSRVIREYLGEHGPATREELVAVLAAAGLETGYSFERHLLYRAALEGRICLGPDRGIKPTYVRLEDWIGRPLKPVPREAALARLAERYLAAYAPAAPPDMVAWSGLPATDVRAAWDAAAAGLVEVTVAGRPAWLPRERLAELGQPEDGRRVQLLPAFDTYLLGHKNRDLIVAPAYAAAINAGGGMIHAVLLVDGQVAGTWQTNRKGRKVKITVDAFDELAPEVQDALDAEIADIERFLS